MYRIARTGYREREDTRNIYIIKDKEAKEKYYSRRIRFVPGGQTTLKNSLM